MGRVKSKAGVFEETRTSLRGAMRIASAVFAAALTLAPGLAPLANAQNGTPGSAGGNASVSAGVAGTLDNPVRGGDGGAGGPGARGQDGITGPAPTDGTTGA